MAEGFDRACHGLKAAHVRSLAGLIFVCLAEEAPADFDRMAADLTPYLAPHGLPACKVAKEVELVEQGNWKLTMENNRECYHCSGNHPELTISLFAEGYGFAPDPGNAELVAQSCRYDALVSDMQASWTERGLPSREIEHLDDRVTGYRTERLPLDGAGESQTRDTRVASRRLLGAFADAKLGGLSVWTQPNSWHHFMSDHIVTFSAIPLTPETTLVRTKWLVHQDAVEGVDYDNDKLTAVWEATNAQDAALVGYAQAGVRTTGYRQGPYSKYTEGLVEKFSAWYTGRLAAHLGI
jgi:Rieske 2Fe-2S family protein